MNIHYGTLPRADEVRISFIVICFRGGVISCKPLPLRRLGVWVSLAVMKPLYA